MASTWGVSWGTSWAVSWDRSVTPPVPPAQDQNSGGWFPHQRRRTKEEIRQERIELGILPPDVVEQVLPVIEAAPKARRKGVLTNLVGKRAAEVSAIDIEIAVQAFRRRARQHREDEELLLLH